MLTHLQRRWKNFLSSSFHTPSCQQKSTSPFSSFQHGWDYWLQLTGPGAQNFDKSIEDQERLRRSRLLSSAIPLIIIAVVVFLPSAFTIPIFWIPIILITLFDVAIILLNRRGKVTTAGLLYTLAIDIAVVVIIFVQPHGFTNNNVPDLDIFALSILLTGLILDRSFIPIVTLLQLTIGTVLFNITPHDPLLTLEINTHLSGNAFLYLEDFFLLEICGAVIAWLSSKSFSMALKRADHAEELDQLVQQQSVLLLEVQRLYQEKALAAETDAITHLLNHRAIMTHISEEIALCQKQENISALLFVDLDHFKRINDTWGHRAGDMVLRETAKRLQAALPVQSFVGRYGGEEFAIILSNTGLSSASLIAEQIKTSIITLPYIWQAEDTQKGLHLLVTASIGVAIYGLHGTTAEILLEQADRAMYCAKKQGRNRVCIAHPDETPGEQTGSQQTVVQKGEYTQQQILTIQKQTRYVSIQQ